MDPAVIPAVEGGTISLLRLIDVGEGIDLERARAATGTLGARRGGTVLRGPERGPGGVVLSSQPLDLDVGTVEVEGIEVRSAVRLFDFGVASVRFEIKIEPGTSCQQLIRTAAALERMAAIDEAARAVWARVAGEIQHSLQGTQSLDLMEDYTIFEVTRVTGCETADEALAALEPARLLLGEPERALAAHVIESYRKRAVRYYADDAVVVGWNAALVLDPEAGRDVLEVLEIANARLLELRYYDAVLARELARVYDAAEAARRASTLFRSPFVRVARRAATLFVEMADLYDRVQGSVTLVGDAYTARLYREAGDRFRLDEISAAVKDKLGTLSNVSEILGGEISHRRAVALESAIVLLIVLEVVLGLIRH